MTDKQKFEISDEGKLVNKDGEDVDFEEDLTFDD